MARSEARVRTFVNGWSLVGWAALGLAAMVGTILAVEGTGEEGLRAVIRATARTSVTLFALAFAASSLHRAWPTAASRWILRNRRYLGVSFATSHFAHLLAIFALCGWSPAGVLVEGGLVGVTLGGVGYLFLAAMTITSFDRTAAWLGPRRWKRLHTVGAYYLWTIFFVSFTPRAFGSPPYAIFALGLLGVLVLRLRTRTARRVPAAVLSGA
jgi:hypothetical protein